MSYCSMMSPSKIPDISARQKKKEGINNYKECVNAIAEECDNELTLHRDQNEIPMKGYLEAVVEEKKEEYCVSCNISCESIRSCIRQGSLAPTHTDTCPLMLDAESVLIEIFIQMGKM